MILFLFFYSFIYLFFFIFSTVICISFFFYFIFLCAYNLDSVAFLQFDVKEFKSNLKEIQSIYFKLALVFCHNFKEFLLGDDFYKYSFSFRKLIILFIIFTGYFHYFLLFIIIFFFSVLFLLFFFSYLRPLFEGLHKTINIYSKRSDQIIWNEQIYIFFNSYIKDEGLLKFTVYIFSQKAIVKLLEFFIFYFIDGLESFCRQPTWFYIFSDFILVFEKLVFFYKGMLLFIE